MLRLRFAIALPLLLASADASAADHPSGAALVRLLGPHAGIALSSTGRDDTLDALVPLPDGAPASALGLEAVVPGFGRLRGGAPAFLAFERAHPELPIDVAPPLHMLLDRAGLFTHATVAHSAGENGSGVLVGVADTGLDVTHADFLDSNGRTRVAWLLDLSARPYGKYPDLEQKYGVVDANGVLLQGAVYAAADLDQLAGTGIAPPSDPIGHGTHVTSIAAGNGGPVTPGPHYVGFAPEATILFARVTRDSTGSIDNGDLVRSVQFLFDRADAMALPIAVNLSLGTDFGPHDGTMDWETVLASYVGPAHPGHALVAAAGNSGSIYDTPVHQSVRVSPGARMTVPIQTHGATSGALEVWVAMRSGATLSVGLAGPDGEWIAPVGDGNEAGKNTSQYNAGVINGSSASKSPVPAASHGAVAVVSGRWPSGTYAIELDGEGTADLYVEGTGDVSIGENAGFTTAVREGTINLPATNPSILGVGCTVNKPTWTSITGALEAQTAPVLDDAGGKVLFDSSGTVETRPLAEGETCWFSSAGPTLTGVSKPEISAPGGVVAAAMSVEAHPGVPESIFSASCPSKDGSPSDKTCLQVDATHGVSQGTSMSAPMVAGAITLLFQKDPTLTQDRIVSLLQAGAHDFRGSIPFDDQTGPGELDVTGALAALEQSSGSTEYLPAAAASWITLGASYFAADGSTPLTAIVELRTLAVTAGIAQRGDGFDPSRLRAVVQVNGESQPSPALTRHAPGVWSFVIPAALATGRGGSTLTVGATFDGAPIVRAKSIPIAADIGRAEYASRVGKGCSVSSIVPLRRDRTSALEDVVACALASLAFGLWRTRSFWGRGPKTPRDWGRGPKTPRDWDRGPKTPRDWGRGPKTPRD